MSERVRLGIGLVTALLLAAGCAGARDHGVKGARTTLPPHCVSGSRHAVGSPDAAWAAVVIRRTTAYRIPGRLALAGLERLNANRVPTVLGVVGERLDARCRATWLHVALPLRPNGVTGWVRARDVQLELVRTRITVDLSEKRVRLYRRGRLVLSSVAAIGSSATPTPVGRYYVNQRLLTEDPGGPFGPGAVGISAFSPVLTGWTQGGPIAIHGTNAPWSIGHAVSNGCIRVPNSVLRRLFAQALAGTPVFIKR
jgi:L,D-transpeptidase catalytic domain